MKIFIPKIIVSALGLIGAVLWFFPLGEFYVAFLKHTMVLSGRHVDHAPLSYGVPIFMTLYAVCTYLESRSMSVIFSIGSAVSVIALYKGLGGGYTWAFWMLSLISAICVLFSLGSLIFKSQKSDK